MPRGNWCGIETLGPEDARAPASARHYDSRNYDGVSRAVDRALAQLSPRLVRKANGHTVTLAGHMPLKPGDVVLETAGIDEPIEVSPGEHVTKREHLHREIERNAHEVKPWPRKTGRLRWIDGEGFCAEIVDDRSIAVAHGARFADAIVGGRK